MDGQRERGGGGGGGQGGPGPARHPADLNFRAWRSSTILSNLHSACGPCRLFCSRAAACPSAANLNESAYAAILAGLRPARMTSTLLPWALTSAFDFTFASATLPTPQGRSDAGNSTFLTGMTCAYTTRTTLGPGAPPVPGRQSARAQPECCQSPIQCGFAAHKRRAAHSAARLFTTAWQLWY